jgi:mRNA interferase RelE/StbE
LAGGEPPKVQYKASVAGDLKRLDRAAAARVLAKVEKALSGESSPGSPLAGESEGLFQIRVGGYRVIDAPTRSGCLVLRIAHRREVYRKGRP